MLRTDVSDPCGETQAEAALQLLRSLANAGEDPDKFAQACLDWSRLSDDAMSVPDFLSILSMLSGGHDAPSDTARSDYDPAEVFSMTVQGKILSISRALSDHLGVGVGERLIENFAGLVELGETEAAPRLLTVADRFGIQRQVSLYPITTEGQVTGYMARAILMRLSPRVRAHLGDTYGFTKSELEILELVLRRFNLDQVAQLRGIKMNTVRTHVARLIQKLDCHSLVEAVSTAVEISTILAGDPPITTPAQDQHTQTQEARLVSLETPGHSMEYRRYGSTLGRPVLVLHSLEYGFAPSDEMIDAAHARGLSLIFPMRPGFGASTATNTLAEATRNVKEFIRVLGLKDISLIGLSLAAPLALAVQDKNPRIRETKLINYGLNVGDKLSQIRPRWIGGLLRMTLNSPASFMFGVRSMVSMIHTFGGLRFYRTLYRNQSADLDYLEQNADLFDRAADTMASADRTNVSIDLETAFLPNPDIEPLINRAAALEVISSADQHGVGPDDVKADAARLGVGFQHVSHTGRNWMFQNPNTLFDIMAAQ